MHRCALQQTTLATRLALLLALAASSAFAGGAGDPGAPWVTQIGMARSAGMADAMTAFASSNDAILDNPAGVGLNRSYHIELDGMDDVKYPAEGVIVSVADSTTMGIGSGLLFERWGAGKPGGRGEGWLGGLSYAYQQGGFLFGGTTRLLHFAGPGGAVIHNWSEDFGVMGRTGAWSFGAVLQNFSLDLSKIPLFPLTSALGIAYGTDADWHVSVDYKTNMNDTSNLKHLLAFGGEYLFDRTFALRAGYRWDISNHLGWITCGASIYTEKVAVHFAYRRRVEGAMEQALEAGVTVFLE